LAHTMYNNSNQPNSNPNSNLYPPLPAGTSTAIPQPTSQLYNNPFISAFPQQVIPMTAPNTNNYNLAPTAPPPYAYVPPPMQQRAKTQEELERERKDAELARALFADQKSPKAMKDDEEFAKRLVFEDSLKTKEQKMLQLLQDEAAAVRLQKEEEALQGMRRSDDERERKDAEEARRLQQEEESALRREEEARRNAQVARTMYAEDESLSKLLKQEEAAARRRTAQQYSDEELALKFQREEERRIQEEKDKAVARRIQEEETRAAEAERRRLAEESRRIREEERVRQEAIRREREREREEERRRVDDERRRVDQILSDAELARRLENQLHIYVPPPPPPPVYQNYPTVNQHTLAIHSQFCGCNKHNQWNNNHIHKIHSRYCNCPHPYYGHYTNAGLTHTHGVGCRIYCKYQNHVHTGECCRKQHTHNTRCHCSAKFA